MFNPGSARYGNFINYYSFNPPLERLKLIPKDIFKSVLNGENDEAEVVCALDVGCNSGELTMNLFDYFNETTDKKNVKILGIDVDPVLIQRSTEANQNPDNILFKKANVMSGQDRLQIIETFLKENKKNRFNVTFLFSITMWIHLINGDNGLKDFLKYISLISKYILVEPQTWKNYKSAVRRMKRSNSEPFEHFPLLQWRDDVVDRISDFLLNSCSMKLVKQLGETSWDRRLLFFEKNQ